MKNVTLGMIDLKSSSFVSLDTNIFINALKRDTPESESAKQLLERIRKVKPNVSVSTLMIEEFFIHVYKQKKEKEIPIYLDFINLEGLCKVIDINQSLAMLAAKLRAKYTTLRTPDALHLASAIISGAKVFITTDRRIPRKINNLTIKVLT